MKTKPRPKPAPKVAEKETAVFLAGLKRHGQVQEVDAPLKPGVTHVLKRAGPKGKPKLVRKRFSAI
jgi:hypothetical protein